MQVSPSDIHRFWFGDLGDGSIIPPESRRWFSKDIAFDHLIKTRFESIWELAVRGKLTDWEKQIDSRLSLVIVLDQFSRNMYRNSPKAFSADARALPLSLSSIKTKEDKKLFTLERVFLYLPMEHSEELEIQTKCVDCFTNLYEETPASLKSYVEENVHYAKRHHEIIERFGRFPHRNQTLGRTSTPEEIEFLREPMSSF